MELVTFQHCYDAMKSCKEPCALNCMGLPTLEGIIVFVSIIVIVIFISYILWLCNSKVTTIK